MVPIRLCTRLTDTGRELQLLAPSIISRHCASRYLGYLEAQKQQLMGERGQKKVNRPELEARHPDRCEIHLLPLHVATEKFKRITATFTLLKARYGR